MGFTMNSAQMVGIGNGLITAIAIISGAWFPITLVGGAFETIATIFPFYNAVALSRALLNGANFEWYRVYILVAYAVIIPAVSALVTTRRLKKA